MIVSVDKNESQIWPVHGVRVRLNGEVQKHCTYANEELGYIIVYDLSEDGSIALWGNNIRKKVLFGTVEIFVGDSFK